MLFRSKIMQKITPFLWYNGNIEEVVDFYTSVFKSSKVISRNPMGATIELEGQQLYLFNGGPLFPFTEAISTRKRVPVLVVEKSGKFPAPSDGP